jgi:hypothetical protein
MSARLKALRDEGVNAGGGERLRLRNVGGEQRMMQPASFSAPMVLAASIRGAIVSTDCRTDGACRCGKGFGAK